MTISGVSRFLAWPVLASSQNVSRENQTVTMTRPPLVTTNQRKVLLALESNATRLSNNATTWVMDFLENTILPNMKIELEEAWYYPSIDEFYEMVHWELQHLPMGHNAPGDANDPVFQMDGGADDSTLDTNLKSGYIQNQCQRIALGMRQGKTSADSWWPGERLIQRRWGFPAFNEESQKHDNDAPTMREANDCPNYLTLNIGKKQDGFPFFGSVLYILDPHKSNHTFWLPYDSGHFSWLRPVINDDVGTLNHHDHVLKIFAEYENDDPKVVRNGTDEMLWMMKRWWVPNTTYDDCCSRFQFYWESDFAGNFLLPDALNYMLLNFAWQHDGQESAEGLWGTVSGEQIQKWSKENRRPLLWAGGADSGLLIDATVNWIASNKITQSDANDFVKLWNANVTFAELQSRVNPYVQFVYINYFTREPCYPAYDTPQNHIMGLDGEHDCVYWTDESPALLKWECHNDGTCSSSTAPQARFDSEEDCMATCGKSWLMVSNVGGWCSSHVGSTDAWQINAAGAHCEPLDDADCCPNFQSAVECEAEISSMGCTTERNKHMATWLISLLCVLGLMVVIGTVVWCKSRKVRVQPVTAEPLNP